MTGGTDYGAAVRPAAEIREETNRKKDYGATIRPEMEIRREKISVTDQNQAVRVKAETGRGVRQFSAFPRVEALWQSARRKPCARTGGGRRPGV